MKIILEGLASEMEDSVRRLRVEFRVQSVSEQIPVPGEGICRVCVDAEVPVRDLYQSILTLKDDVSDDLLRELTPIIETAFVNRAGCVKNISKTPRVFVFQGCRDEVGCMDLGMFALREIPGFLSYVKSWDWLDEDPPECCSMLDVFARHPY